MASRIALYVVAILALVQPVQAQSDLLNRGKSLLDKLSGGGGASPIAKGALSDTDIAAGLKEALRVGSDRVVAELGVVDGFNADPKIHIPLPDSLRTVQQTLGRIGMGGALDDLELRLNRAAETATPKAKAIFRDAIAAMTWDDVRKIFDGPDDAATQYLKAKMSTPLKAEMRPVVDSSLAEVGAIRSYDSVMAQYKAVPFVPDVKADLTDHVLERGLDGLFLYLAAEEAAIRQDPAKRSTELLRKVFGAR
jgi:hypothetical protein